MRLRYGRVKLLAGMRVLSGLRTRSSSVFNAYVIEIQELPAAVVTRTGCSYTFHALTKSLDVLNGTLFPNAIAAERAALRHLRKQASKTLQPG